MTPSAHGEGKTITSIGLAMALERRGHRAIPCLRQPSLGPVFGIKGGATGGGRATVEPSDEINLGFTGDLYAVASAQNLLCAMVDNHLHHGNALGLDPGRIAVPRTIDMNDRALRRLRVGVDASIGPERADRFVIAAASETATIHVLASGFADLGKRLGAMIVGWDRTGAPVRARQLGADGAMASILRWAMAPNLVVTSEGTPALVHGGPFANLGVGTASTLSIRLALARAEYAIVEAGFATDLGAEKFVDLVAPTAGFRVDAIVLVGTVAGIRYQGGDPQPTSGTNRAALSAGFANLDFHVESLRRLRVSPVVALNRHPTDDAQELAAVRDHLEGMGCAVTVTDVFRQGSAGAVELAELVHAEARARRPARSGPVGSAEPPARLDRIARSFYGAAGAQLGPEATAALGGLAMAGLDRARVCVAKTPLSLGDDPAIRGGPSGRPVSVRSLEPWGGAGIVLARLGSVVSMPGLPEHPAAERISLGARGQVRGVV
jgi:formate--tetrahydrofolate ligase